MLPPEIVNRSRYDDPSGASLKEAPPLPQVSSQPQSGCGLLFLEKHALHPWHQQVEQQREQ